LTPGLPTATAILPTPVADASVSVPTAMAPLKSPSASASVPGPSPIAKLVGVLVQPVPAATPLIDAHVALAVPAAPSAAAASPAATAPSRTAPAGFSFVPSLFRTIGGPSPFTGC